MQENINKNIYCVKNNNGDIMKHEIDLKKYKIRTDLIIEDTTTLNSSKTKNQEYSGIKVTTINLNEKKAQIINKKPGNYITIEFEDVTDKTNKHNLTKIFSKQLKNLLKNNNIKDNDTCLIIGLGNKKSTPDSLGPLVIDNILVTRHLFMLEAVEEGYRCVSSFSPGVTGTTGIETSSMVKSIIDTVKPSFIIVIDALASSSVERVNKTIQMSDTGIHPGSGVGNSRKEISYETTGIPVIAIGIPTVVDAVSVVSNTIEYMHKHYAFSKKFIGSPLNRLVSSEKINYLKEEIKVDDEDKTNLLGLVGSLSEPEIRQLIFEVLTPIGYNLMITPKEIDFEIDKLSEVISDGINMSLHKKTIK